MKGDKLNRHLFPIDFENVVPSIKVTPNFLLSNKLFSVKVSVTTP